MWAYIRPSNLNCYTNLRVMGIAAYMNQVPVVISTTGTLLRNSLICTSICMECFETLSTVVTRKSHMLTTLIWGRGSISDRDLVEWSGAKNLFNEVNTFSCERLLSNTYNTNTCASTLTIECGNNENKDRKQICDSANDSFKYALKGRWKVPKIIDSHDGS